MNVDGIPIIASFYWICHSNTQAPRWWHPAQMEHHSPEAGRPGYQATFDAMPIQSTASAQAPGLPEYR
jgi:hypothetical protein